MTSRNSMQNQLNKKSPMAAIVITWGIIMLSYCLIRILFLLTGLPASNLLGGCLAVIPYIIGALFMWKSCEFKNCSFYFAGLLVPAIMEKVIIYLLGAFFYRISPLQFSNVMLAISSKAPFINLSGHPMAPMVINISFLSIGYLFVSIGIATLLATVLSKFKNKSVHQ